MVCYRADSFALWIHGKFEGKCKLPRLMMRRLNTANCSHFGIFLFCSGFRFGNLSSDNALPAASIRSIFCLHTTCNISNRPHRRNVYASLFGKSENDNEIIMFILFIYYILFFYIVVPLLLWAALAAVNYPKSDCAVYALV